MKYEELNEGARSVVDLVCVEFSDLFDNDEFGPFLEEFTQFDKNRVAELLEIAMGKLALMVKIQTRWSLTSYRYSNPVKKHALVLSLTVELIRHFIRSYVEVPDVSSVGAPIANRRDYMNRWQGILDDYKRQLDDAAKSLEIDEFMGEAEAGNYTKVLGSYSGIGFGYGLPMAERPTMDFWWV